MSDTELNCKELLQEYLEKYPKTILAQIENIYGLNLIKDYVISKGEELTEQKETKKRNSYITVALSFYKLLAIDGCKRKIAIEKVMNKYKLSAVSGIEKNINKFNKEASAILKTGGSKCLRVFIFEKMGLKPIDTIDIQTKNKKLKIAVEIINYLEKKI